MKIIVVSLLCFLSVQAIIGSPTSDSSEAADVSPAVTDSSRTICTPNEVTMQDCNRCKCSPNGIVWLCTRLQACPQNENGSETNQEEQKKKCTPGTQWKEDCNDCWCTATGGRACTRKACVPLEPVKTRRSAENCVEGESYIAADGCNTCVCGPKGSPAACTLRLCVQQPVRSTRAVETKDPNAPQFTCAAGELFNHADGCNTCICNEQGTNATCTLRTCMKPLDNVPVSKPASLPSNKKCVPGTRFMSDDGCNTCFCTREGKVGCTLMFCDPKEKEEEASSSTKKN